MTKTLAAIARAVGLCTAASTLGTTALLCVVASRAVAQYPDTSKARPPAAKAAADTTPVHTFGAFVDTYYAWDFNRPHFFDRSFTTQPARYAEANINLAFIETKIAGPRYRGRLALQWGTSVQSNYFAEPRLGVVSGPSVSQFIQEATAGYQLTPRVWLDAGIFFSHLGYESWISRDNLTYTRSLVADFSPYYETGAKMTVQASQELKATFALVNGWQIISADNSTPGGGLRLDYSPDSTVTFTYDNYFGNAGLEFEPVKMRIYHDAIVAYNPKGRWQLEGVYSLGSQSHSASNNGTASWWGMTAIAKYHVTPTFSVVGRVERYSDPSEVIIITGLPDAFLSNGASLGVDANFQPRILWRTEVRGFRSSHAIWPLHELGHFGRDDGFIVTSLALTF